MYVYVIYEDASSDTIVRQFDNAGLACNFIEETMDEDKSCELADFQVIHGQPFGVKEVIKRKIYLTNAS